MGLFSGLFKSFATFGIYDPSKDRESKPEDYRDASMHSKPKEPKGEKGRVMSGQKRLDRPELRKEVGIIFEKHEHHIRFPVSCPTATKGFCINQILALIPDIEEAKKQERKDIGEWLLGKDNMLSKDEKVSLLETLISELVVGKVLKEGK